MTTANNRFPAKIRKIYLMAICGTGMGSLAGLLKAMGFDVCGSDNNVYPPMSTELAKQGIRVSTPYDSANLKNEQPDLVVVGNAISRTNVEAAYLLETDIPYVSMPQALNHFFLHDKDTVVISGTHGKTTTSSLMAFLLSELGLEPSFMIGGVTRNFSSNFQIGKGKYFVIEGDEYDTAFFDKGPKFLHYNPKHVVMTSLEFDHADIYRDLDHIIESFTKLAQIMPKNGSLHYNDGYPALERVVPHCQAGFLRKYGVNAPDWQLADYQATKDGARFTIKSGGKTVIELNSPMAGVYNALNALSCFSVLQHLGLDLKKAAAILPKFQGVKRRQEVLLENDRVVLIDDFAHHPTAVAETIAAIRQKYPQRKLIAVFEPRSNSSKRDIFQKDYVQSFLAADEAIIGSVFMPEKITTGHVLDVDRIVSELTALGKASYHFKTTDDIVRHITAPTTQAQAVLVMSNGSFDHLTKKLIEAYGRS
jgi:UDP-N-acetylmuramate: L-alanyl-gamma-D-glutamyl-meso-diaminopimelate ligase